VAELNLKQITDKLNEEFTTEERRLVFWYDDNAEFAAEINSLELNNAKILKLEKDNQLYERELKELKADLNKNGMSLTDLKKAIANKDLSAIQNKLKNNNSSN